MGNYALRYLGTKRRLLYLAAKCQLFLQCTNLTKCQTCWLLIWLEQRHELKIQG